MSAGLIGGDAGSMDGRSWINDREIGEFFFGATQNPLSGNAVLLPKQDGREERI
jgi:hypothetical protein